MLFEVEDTGIGIEADQLEAIFSPFHQVGLPQSKAAGSCLGLAISQRLAKMMDGELGVHSVPGRGSVFWLEVALHLAEGWAEQVEIDKLRIVGFEGPGRKALIVDDKPENRAILVEVLAPLGFEVLEAVDGEDALVKAKTWQPDVILMDLIMSGMNGFEAARRIRQIPELAETIIIAVSSSAFEEDQ